MITREDVENIARLCRIALTDAERSSFEQELSAILDFVKTLGEVATDAVEPLTGGSDLAEALREDRARSRGAGEGESRGLVDQAPSVRNGYVEVQAVFKRL